MVGGTPANRSGTDGSYTLSIPRSFDTNRDGKLNASEGVLVLTGGTIIATNQRFGLTLRGLVEGEVISPLTTLVADLVRGGMTVSNAEARVRAWSGATTLNVLTTDSMFAMIDGNAVARTLFAAEVKLYQTLAAGMMRQDNLWRELVTHLEANQNPNLSDAATLKALFTRTKVVNLNTRLVSMASTLDRLALGTDWTLLYEAATQAIRG